MTFGSGTFGAGTFGGFAITSSPPTVAVQVDFTTDLSAGIAYGEQVLQSSPYVFHRLQEVGGAAADSSGNSRAGTFGGTVTLDQTAGKPVTGETAARYVTLGAPGSIAFAGVVPPSDLLTVEAWVYVASLSGSAATEYAILSNGGTSMGASILNFHVTGVGRLAAYIGNIQVGTAAATIAAATWYHVAVAYDGANKAVAFYVNGAAAAVDGTFGAVPPLNPWTASNVTTAWRWGNTGVGANVSRIAEPAVYLAALQQDDIAAHYTAAATAPFAGYTWTDVTSYVLFDVGLARRLGRPSNLDDVTPTTLTYTLRNDDRRFEPGNVGVTANAVANPSFEVDLSYWSTDATFTGVARTLVSGSYRMTGFAATTTPYFLYAATFSSGDALRVDVTEGGVITISGRAIRATRVGTVRVIAQFRDRFDGVVSTAQVDTASVGDQRVSGTFTVPASAAVVLPIFQFLGSVVGDGCGIDDVRVADGTSTAYVDGGTGGYAWAGTSGLSKTLVPAPYRNLEPGRPTRVVMTQDGVAYDWAFGFVQDWPQEWDRSVRFGTVPIVATDYLERLNQENIGTRVFAQQSSGSRLTVLLNASGQPTSMRQLDAGLYTLMGGTFENVTSGAHARQAARTDRGLFFFDGRGWAVFHAGDHRTTATRSTVARGTIGNTTGEIPHWSPQFATPASLIRDEITIRRPGGVDQTVSDQEAQKKYGKRSYSDELLLTDDAAAATYAAQLLVQYTQPQTRISSVTFNPAVTAGLWQHSLGVQLSDFYWHVFRPLQGDRVTRKVFVEGVEDSYRNGEYLSTWALSVG